MLDSELLPHGGSRVLRVEQESVCVCVCVRERERERRERDKRAGEGTVPHGGELLILMEQIESSLSSTYWSGSALSSRYFWWTGLVPWEF